MFCCNQVCISPAIVKIIRPKYIEVTTLTFLGHMTSSVTWPMVLPCGISYLCAVGTESLPFCRFRDICIQIYLGHVFCVVTIFLAGNIWPRKPHLTDDHIPIHLLNLNDFSISCILMSVIIVGGEVLFWWDCLRTLDYLLYIFVLRSFYCIFKIVTLHCIFFSLSATAFK